MRRTKRALVVSFLAVLASALAFQAEAGWEWRNPMPQGNDLYDVWGASPTNVVAVGDRGTILHYDGVNWSIMPIDTTESLNGIWGISSTDVFAVGSGGTLGIFLTVVSMTFRAKCPVSASSISRGAQAGTG